MTDLGKRILEVEADDNTGKLARTLEIILDTLDRADRKGNYSPVLDDIRNDMEWHLGDNE